MASHLMDKIPAALLDEFRDLSVLHIARENTIFACGVNKVIYAEKLEPQPQDFVEFGLMKLKPWRIRVSSKSRTIPAR